MITGKSARECNILEMRNFFQLMKIPGDKFRCSGVWTSLEEGEETLGGTMVMIRKVEPRDQEAVLRLLRTDFYPYEPCAVGLDLCPLGYR